MREPFPLSRASSSGSEALLWTRARAMLDAWWKPKATNLFAVLYAVTLLSALPPARTFALLLPSALTIIGIGTFGHLANDWFDRHADAMVGKPNRLAGLPRSQRSFLVLAALAVASAPWLALPSDASSAALLLLEFILLIAYVVPPVRLKERSVWPIVADAAYAYAVPALLAAHTFFLASGTPDRRAFLAALCVWQLGLGARHFLNHLALDRRNDAATSTPTLATRKGNRFIHRLIRRVVSPIELTGFLAVVAIFGGSQPLLPAALGLVWLIWCSIHVVLTVGRRYPLAAYRFTTTSVDRLYQDVLPLILLAFLVVADWRFSALALVHILLFAPAVPPASAGALLGWPAIAAGQRVRARCLEHRGAGRDAASARVGARAGAAPLPIAVVNINKFKYTETFIHGAIAKLPYRVYYLHGGELPRFDDDDRHFLSNWPSVQSAARLVESLFLLEPDHFLKNSVAGYLQARQVRLILAHFGPVGARMAPIARDLGIPLVVWFHGYDAFHAETVRQCAEGYRYLLAEADRILAVSEVMMRRLRQMGAPEAKLVHLPAFVNLELFTPSDHSPVGPKFLAVGRFAETKSPHLTLLAFHRVAQRIPHATLTMIGKGGGGELFEACLILVRSLGLEGRVQLKGVLSHEQVAMEMQRARVFVQHSITTPESGDMEGKPVAIMEAMASGLPVVSTRHSGIVELIEDGVSGFLVDEYDVDAMAEAMFALATNDELVARMGHDASRRIHTDPLLNDHVGVLSEIIGGCIARSERPVA